MVRLLQVQARSEGRERVQNLPYILKKIPQTLLINHFIILILFLEKIIIPEHIAVRLINNTVISLDTFYNNTMIHLHHIHSNAIKNHARMRDRVEFNRYLETMTYEEVATTMSMDANKKMRRKIKQSKKIVDDEDLNVDMESSGDKDQLMVTTFPPPTSEPSTDMNDTTIIFDQDPEE